MPATKKHRELPLIVGFGGSIREGSATDIALLSALRSAEKAGARTKFYGGQYLKRMPFYNPADEERTVEQSEFLASIREADGLIVASTSYGSNISGLVKNALDLICDLSDDARPFLQGRAVSCIVTGVGGGQSEAMALMALRSTVHEYGAWTTPTGVTLNYETAEFSVLGFCLDPKIAARLDRAGRDVFDFAIAHTLFANEEVS